MSGQQPSPPRYCWPLAGHAGGRDSLDPHINYREEMHRKGFKEMNDRIRIWF